MSKFVVTDLRGKLLVLVGDQVDAEGELVDTGTLTSEIEDLDLGVGDTTVEPGLGVGLVCDRISVLILFHNSSISSAVEFLSESRDIVENVLLQ
jgi:hypothetical protein